VVEWPGDRAGLSWVPGKPGKTSFYGANFGRDLWAVEGGVPDRSAPKGRRAIFYPAPRHPRICPRGDHWARVLRHPLKPIRLVPASFQSGGALPRFRS